jgi:hypothetical protein
MGDGAMSDKILEALKDGIRVAFRTKNHQLLYSLERPDPTATGVTDAMLCAALLHAGTHFKVEPAKRSAAADREDVQRFDGRVVRYKESINIDWENETIRSTKGRELTLTVLSIIVRDLSEAVAKQKKETHGAN